MTDDMLTRIEVFYSCYRLSYEHLSFLCTAMAPPRRRADGRSSRGAQTKGELVLLPGWMIAWMIVAMYSTVCTVLYVVAIYSTVCILSAGRLLCTLHLLTAHRPGIDPTLRCLSPRPPFAAITSSISALYGLLLVQFGRHLGS